MRAYLLSAPRWVLSVGTGLFFGLFMTVFFLIQDGHVLPAVINGPIGGILFGAIMGRQAARQNNQVMEALGPLTPPGLRDAIRATNRGPVPEDRQIRQAACRLTNLQLHQLSRQREWSLAFFGLMDVLYVLLALTRSPWWWAAAALFSVALAGQVWLPGHLRRRLDRLQVDQP